MTLSPRPFRWTVLVLCAAVGGCFLWPAPDPGPPPFSHALHGKDKGLKCSTCHPGVLLDGPARLPQYGICTPCHDPADEEDLPPKERLWARFGEDGSYKTKTVANIPDEVRFSHLRHASKGLECADCHGNIADSERTPPESAVTKDDCMTCHSRRKISNACAVCHKAITKSWLPPTHKRAWTVRHGQIFLAKDEATVNRCSMCHNQPASCDACHQTQAPRNHTNFWRRRGHAVGVSLNRQTCATCHRSNFCNRCHLSTEPQNHTAGWGSPRNRHCISCHVPLRGEGCFTCHKSTPSHTATRPPADHHPGMNCRQCHGAGVRLPHPDNGTLCTACHRF